MFFSPLQTRVCAISCLASSPTCLHPPLALLSSLFLFYISLPLLLLLSFSPPAHFTPHSFFKSFNKSPLFTLSPLAWKFWLFFTLFSPFLPLFSSAIPPPPPLFFSSTYPPYHLLSSLPQPPSSPSLPSTPSSSICHRSLLPPLTFCLFFFTSSVPVDS